jgi:phosphocarrier protein FPr
VPRTPGGPDVEQAALVAALDRAREQVGFARESIASQVGDEHAAMLDAHTALLGDPSVIEPAERAIAAGRRAEEAWSAAVDEAAGRLAGLDDPYLRARAEDVRDVGRRVLGQFAGTPSGPPRLRGPGILVARELGAGETAMLDLSQVTGIAVATGSPTSHAAILARALGVPAVVGVGEILTSIGEEQEILVDGDRGVVRIGPDPDTVARVRAERAQREQAAASAARRAEEPAVTRDGVVIEVAANIAAPDEARGAVAAGADGVGLFRTEFLFMNRDGAPTEDEQEAAYRAAASAVGARRLVLRTFDAGGDKPVPYLALAREDNPFLGQRGIRVSLAHPDVFAAQLRAALRVAADHRVAIMFPMVATPAEFRAARAHVDRARDALSAQGTAAGRVELGVMIEVPSAALCAEALAREVDFFSIGTNDLTQYTLAAERGNPAVTDLADGLHPAVLRLIGMVGEAGERHGRLVGVCGELAGDPAAIAPLVGLGVRELSVSAPRIAETKDQVRGVDAGDAAGRVSELLALDSADAVRAALAAD